ncbi:MAG: hypothetical protein ACOY94_12775 [Bacillota bacterium]
MNRQRILLGLLIVVAVTLLPSYFADRAAIRLKMEMAAVEKEMEVLRAKALKVREEEERLAVGQRAMADLKARFVSQNPFADMERVVAILAARSGMQVVELNLVGAELVKELPTMVRYTAAVELAGTAGGLITFVRLAEEHPLLIEVPDLKLSIPRTDPGVAQINAPIRPRLTLSFFGVP